MPPLSPSDLDPMHGRIATQLADVINECNSPLKTWKPTNFSRTKTTSHQYDHGFYFFAYDDAFECYLCFSSYLWYHCDNHTPIWLTVKDADSKVSQKINDALKRVDRVNSYDENVGIVLSPGMDKEKVVQHIVARTKEILTKLHNELRHE